MATVADITQGSSYRGDPALGGGLAISAVIDPSPLQRLATFTFYRDRDLWEKKNADDKVAADKIAAIAAYDINSPLKPFSADLKKELSEIQAFVRENPDALVYSRNPEKFQELSERINTFSNKRKGATASDVLYNKAKAEIEQIVDPRERELKRRELDLKVDKLFQGGLENAYNQQLEATPDLKPSDFIIPTAGQTTRSFIQQLPNSNITTEVTYTDLDDLRVKSELLAAGEGESIDTEAEWFKRLTPEEQKLELEKSGLSSSKRMMLQQLSTTFQSALQKWKTANPNIDINTVDPNSLPSGILEDNIRSVRVINDSIDQLNELVLQGQIKDPSGRVRTTPYSKINLEDGLSEAEIIFMKSLQDAKSPLVSKIDKNIQQTDDALQTSQLAETVRHNKATENINRGQLKLEQDKWSASMTGGESVKNGAMERAKRIYNDMKKLADKNGVIHPDKLRQLNAEQLKYLGTEVVETSEQGVPRTVFKPLSFEGLNEKDDDDRTEYAIQLINGEIRVLTPREGKKLGKTSDGRPTGLWDNNRSTNIFNVATNVLNEQLKNAGAKELNAYLPIDLGTGGVSENTTGGGVKVSGSTKTSYSLNGKTYPISDVEAAAKASGMTLQEYIQKAGLK